MYGLIRYFMEWTFPIRIMAKWPNNLLRWDDERLVSDQGNQDQNCSMKVPVVAAQPLLSKKPQQTPPSRYIRAGRCRLENISNTTREGKASRSTFKMERNCRENAAVSLMVQCLKWDTPDRRYKAGVGSKQAYREQNATMDHLEAYHKTWYRKYAESSRKYQVL